MGGEGFEPTPTGLKVRDAAATPRPPGRVSGEWSVVSGRMRSLNSPLTNHHSLPLRRFTFCCTFPVLRRARPTTAGPFLGRWTLSTTVPCGARTFLSRPGRVSGEWLVVSSASSSTAIWHWQPIVDYRFPDSPLTTHHSLFPAWSDHPARSNQSQSISWVAVLGRRKTQPARHSGASRESVAAKCSLRQAGD